MNATVPLTSKRPKALAVLIATAVVLLGILAPTPASAAAPDFLWQAPPDSVTSGSGAGQLNNPRGIVADPDSGHLYVSERVNARISEFTAWGTFVKAWGWDVAPDGAPGDTPSDQLEVCTTACKAGLAGNGVGQVNEPWGVTLDAVGDIYVQENPLGDSSKRVQKFSPAGQFLLMFGGRVNKTRVAEREAQEANAEPVTVTPAEENLCTAADVAGGDICGAGVSGADDGYFSTQAVGNYLTFNPLTGTLFAGDKDRIQEFTTAGAFVAAIDFDAPGDLEAFDGKSVEALAADPVSGDLYLDLQNTKDAYRLDPASAGIVDVLAVNGPKGLAVDVDGNVFVVEAAGSEGGPVSPFEVLGFDSSGNPIAGMAVGDEFAEPPVKGRAIIGLATNVAGPGSTEPGNLYLSYFASGLGSYINAYGPPPIDFEDPPLRAPEIKDQYATAVDTSSAALAAKINPRYWNDATYYVQYGSEQCLSGGWEAPCVTSEPAPPGRLLVKQVTASPRSASAVISGLLPDTAYRYRFAARSTGSGGEDVFGLGGTLAAEGADATFTTFPASTDPRPCANDARRGGASARLPDCRAYELVSPLDKNNGDVRTEAGYGVYQSALGGSSFTYSSTTSFGEPEGAPATSQYLARRGESGWASKAISPPRSAATDSFFGALGTEYKHFSPDLCSGWLRMAYDPPLAPGAVPGYLNLYRRDNCAPGLGGYEALSTVAPPNMPEIYAGLEVQGVSGDDSRALFVAQDGLTPDIPPQPAQCLAEGSCPFMLYLHEAGEPLRFICYLPNGNPIDPQLGAATYQSCSAGTSYEREGKGFAGSFANALSADGESAYFSVTTYTGGTAATNFGPGRIYLRLIEEEETLRVSQTISGAKAAFWGAARDGSAALFEIDDGTSPLDGALFRFDASEEASELIAEEAAGVLGASEDLSHVYFLSEQALPGSGENGNGEEAQAGEPNLYLRIEGAGTRFLGTRVIFPGTAGRPVERRARVSPDGLHAAFMSRAPLTGFDNTDAELGVPAAEVFLYDAEADELHCVSCNRSGARPHGRDLPAFEELPGFESGVIAAARIPGQASALYASRLLSDDGSRLFFESHEALVPGDANGQLDVYQWEEPGTGSCTAEAVSFNEVAGGCVELISSGQSPQDSRFRDASPNGSDVFFSTLSSLLPQDYGLIDIYDARIGGGFPQPTKVPGCEGEACQGPITPPDDPTPASSSFEGAGNVSEKAKKPGRKTSCPKGKHEVKAKGKARCAPKKAKKNKKKTHKKKRANENGRAGR